jgi:hypothetical protein
MIKNGFPGNYHICANYYSNHRQDLTGGTTIWFTIYTNYMKGMTFFDISHFFKKMKNDKFLFCD